MIQCLIVLALCYVLIKIPFWVLGSIRGGGRSSMLGGMVRSFLAYKTLGMLGGAVGLRRARKKKETKPDLDPYTKSRELQSGQMMLPLEGLKRGRPPKTPWMRYLPAKAKIPVTKPKSDQKKAPQLSLFNESGTIHKRLRKPVRSPNGWIMNPAIGQNHMLRIIPRHDPSRARAPEPEPDSGVALDADQGMLINPRGGISSAAAVPRRDRAPEPHRAGPGEQKELNLGIGLWSSTRGTPLSPRIADEPAPRPTAVVVDRDQGSLISRTGRVRPAARVPQGQRMPAPHRAGPGEQPELLGTLVHWLRRGTPASPRIADEPEPGREAAPNRVVGQLPALDSHGHVHRAARARIRRIRRATPPEANDPSGQATAPRRGGGDRGAYSG